MIKPLAILFIPLISVFVLLLMTDNWENSLLGVNVFIAGLSTTIYLFLPSTQFWLGLLLAIFNIILREGRIIQRGREGRLVIDEGKRDTKSRFANSILWRFLWVIPIILFVSLTPPIWVWFSGEIILAHLVVSTEHEHYSLWSKGTPIQYE